MTVHPVLLGNLASLPSLLSGNIVPGTAIQGNLSSGSSSLTGEFSEGTRLEGNLISGSAQLSGQFSQGGNLEGALSSGSAQLTGQFAQGGSMTLGTGLISGAATFSGTLSPIIALAVHIVVPAYNPFSPISIGEVPALPRVPGNQQGICPTPV